MKTAGYHGIDAGKVIMAIFVVAIHTQPLAACSSEVLQTLWSCIVSCAVPFFFLASGFLLGSKVHRAGTADEQAVILKYLVKSIRLYLFWSAVYFPLAAVHFWKTGYGAGKSVLLYLRGLLVMGENYNSWMLWYLLSLIYTVAFIWILRKCGVRMERIALVGAAVFLLGFWISYLTGYTAELPAALEQIRRVLSKTLVNGRIFTGFLYVPIGMLLADKEISVARGGLLALGGFVGNVCLGGLVGAIMLAACSVGVFMVAAGVKLKDSPVYTMLRQTGTITYFIHMYVWTAYYSLVYHQKTYGPDSFVCTVLCCFVISAAVIAERWFRKDY